MRIRLSVQRHRLPTAEILWVISHPQTNPSSTIARLLSEVDEVIPLESEHWGLEDYVVQVDGFECLHFHKIVDVLSEGDHVTIRPLETPEVRGRTLSGRTQISENGQHLIDGVPFGRPLLRQASRPLIRIPPRKRRRLSTDDWEVPEIEMRGSEEPLRLTNGEGGGAEDEALVKESNTKMPNGGATNNDKNVHFAVPPPEGFEDEDEEDDEDFDPDAMEDESVVSDESKDDTESDIESSSGESSSVVSSDSSSDESSSSDSSDDTSSESDSESEAENIASKKGVKAAPLSVSSKATKSLETSAKHKSPAKETHDNRKTKSTQKISGINGVTQSKSNHSPAKRTEKGSSVETDDNANGDRSKVSVAPGEGKASTKARNERRRIAKRNKNLKRHGILPIEATLEFAQAGQKAKDEDLGSPQISKTGSHDATGLNKVGYNSLQISETGDLVVAPTSTVTVGETLNTAVTTDASGPFDKDQRKRKKLKTALQQNEVEFVERRQRLLQSLLTGGIDIENGDSPEVISPQQSASQAKCDQEQAEEDQEPATKRARLDMAASRRLVFGSLGMRTPKTKSDEDAVRAKLMASTTRSANLHTPQKQQTEVDPADERPDADAWKSKICLAAVECVDTRVTKLSTPPYPFQQRWDPQQKTPVHNGNSARKRKRAAKKRYGLEEFSGAYGYANDIDTESRDYVALDHDGDFGDLSLMDTSGQSVDPDAEGQSFFEASGMSQSTTATGSDLPPLPRDIEELPNLTASSLSVGAIIAFKQLQLSKATNWQPLVSEYRTARIDSVDGSEGFTVQLAVRDRERPDIQYDDNGNRLLSGFEMEGVEDNEEGVDGIRHLELSQIIAPKLISAAQVYVEQNDGAEIKMDSESPDGMVAEEDEVKHVLPMVVAKMSTAVF